MERPRKTVRNSSDEDGDIAMAMTTVTARAARGGPDRARWQEAEAAEREALEQVAVWERLGRSAAGNQKPSPLCYFTRPRTASTKYARSHLNQTEHS